MKQFNEEDLTIIKRRLDYLRRCLDTYKKYESNLNNFQNSDSCKTTLVKIELLRKEKTNELYSMIKKYGWPYNINNDMYNTMLEAFEYGNLDILNKILPYAKNAFILGKVSEEEFNKFLDIITKKEELLSSNNSVKTLK